MQFITAVFKVFSIEDDDFAERANLRVGRNLNLNFSASDVAWNPIDGMHLFNDYIKVILYLTTSSASIQ